MWTFKSCRRIVDPLKTTESPTTEPPTTETTVTASTASTASDDCECTADIMGLIANGYTPNLSKYGQVKLYASGQGIATFAVSHVIHDLSD